MVSVLCGRCGFDSSEPEEEIEAASPNTVGEYSLS